MVLILVIILASEIFIFWRILAQAACVRHACRSTTFYSNYLHLQFGNFDQSTKFFEKIYNNNQNWQNLHLALLVYNLHTKYGPNLQLGITPFDIGNHLEQLETLTPTPDSDLTPTPDSDPWLRLLTPDSWLHPGHHWWRTNYDLTGQKSRFCQNPTQP